MFSHISGRNASIFTRAKTLDSALLVCVSEIDFTGDIKSGKSIIDLLSASSLIRYQSNFAPITGFFVALESPR